MGWMFPWMEPIPRTTWPPEDAPDADVSDTADDPDANDLDATDASGDATPDAPEPFCGDGQVDEALGEGCDDGNGDDTDGCTSDCQIAYACAALPMSCDGANPSTTEHYMLSADGCSFALEPWSQSRIDARSALIDALVARSDGQRSVTQVSGDLNRQGVVGITEQSAYRLRNHDFRGFRWNSGDDNVDYWYPQGITGTSDAYPGGTIGGQNLVLVSWYHRTDDRPTKGVRISMADVTSLGDVDYRHLLLIEPSGTVDNPNFGPVETAGGNALHAGGIVWFGDYLYVADTSGGLRVFDMTRIIRVPDVSDTEAIGISGGRFDAHGYRYAIPELMRYELADDSCSLRFSFAGLDRSSSPPAIVTGEYRSDDIGGRLAVWNLDPTTGFLDVRNGEVRATQAVVSGQTRMQGGVRYEGDFYVSSSSQYEQYGRLYRTRPGFGESSISAWVYGCEDLYIDRASDTIWTAAEFPGDRDVVGIPIRRP